jgi:hypothetical protein
VPIYDGKKYVGFAFWNGQSPNANGDYEFTYSYFFPDGGVHPVTGEPTLGYAVGSAFMRAAYVDVMAGELIGGGWFQSRKSKPASKKPVAKQFEPWVVRNVGALEKKIANGKGKWDGYRNSEGERWCASFPQFWDQAQGRNIREVNTGKWHMGSALTWEIALKLKRGTVVANFNRTKKIYENKEGGNHTCVFLNAATVDGEKGIWVLDQGPPWAPRKDFIPIEAGWWDTINGRAYRRGASNFNVVELLVQPAPKRR